MKISLTLLTLTTILIVCPTQAQRDVSKQQRTIIAAWNQLGPSIDREDELITALNKEFQLHPPWRTVDATEDHLKKRHELIDKIIAEHRKRIQLLEKIKAEDK